MELQNFDFIGAKATGTGIRVLLCVCRLLRTTALEHADSPLPVMAGRQSIDTISSFVFISIRNRDQLLFVALIAHISLVQMLSFTPRSASLSLVLCNFNCRSHPFCDAVNNFRLVILAPTSKQRDLAYMVYSRISTSAYTLSIMMAMP